jgi:hypothetical protein
MTKPTDEELDFNIREAQRLLKEAEKAQDDAAKNLLQAQKLFAAANVNLSLAQERDMWARFRKLTGYGHGDAVKLKAFGMGMEGYLMNVAEFKKGEGKELYAQVAGSSLWSSWDEFIPKQEENKALT